MSLFVTATGTDVGKTLFSALIMARYANQHDLRYLKPVQTGEVRDSETIRRLTNLDASCFLPELYSFSLPASPHFAAEENGSRIDKDRLVGDLKTRHKRKVVIELAGGLLVPLTRDGYYTNLDLIRDVGFPAVLVAATGLGTINHTVLSWRALQSAGIFSPGIIFVGKADVLRADNIRTIADMTGAPVLGDLLLPEGPLSPEIFAAAAGSFDAHGKIQELLS